MRKVDIPMFNCRLRIYRNDERDAFEKQTKVKLTSDYLALSCENSVWIGKPKDVVGTCYHEASHFVEWMLEDWLEVDQGTLRSNTELRAYMTQYFGGKIVEYVKENP